MSKGQRASDLMGIHASGGAIEAFYGGGIRDVVAHLRQCLVDASPTAVSFADLDSLEFSALPMFDDLDMGEGSGNRLFWLGWTADCICLRGSYGTPKMTGNSGR